MCIAVLNGCLGRFDSAGNTFANLGMVFFREAYVDNEHRRLNIANL